MSDAEKQPEPNSPTEPNLEKESISETDVESPPKDVTDTESKDAEKVAGFSDNEINVDADMKVEAACPPEKVPEELDFEDEPTVVNGKSKESTEVKEEEEGEETHTEEGACTPEKKKAEETKDDGECSDGGDEDLEEGELNEKEDILGGGATNSKPTSATKSLCRFYSRGICYFGAKCRFSHINASGNNYYSMFATPTPTPSARGAYDPPTSGYYESSTIMGHTHRSGPLPSRSGSDFVPPPSACSESAAVEECAWVRGLETAKELVKRAHKRKIEDKNFSEKSLNLSLEKNEKNEVFIERDTRDSYKRKRRDMVEFPKYDEPLEAAYDDYREPYREVGFDHFDVRYHREERKGGDRRMENREPRDKRDFRPKSPRSKERYRDDRIDRLEDVEPPPRPSHYSSRNVNNVNSFFDPWRRSKSPKGTARRSRSRSGSYSSVSSYSWSDRSFSSNSYSRSSRSSSRSPPHQKRKLSPTITNPLVSERPGPLLTNTFTTMRDKKPQHTGLPSRSRTPSISRSRSFSRSISMSSVSSASSARGSSRDRDSLSNSSGSRSGRQNSTSILRKQDENAALPVGKTVDPPKVSGPSPTAVPLPSMYLNYPLRENTTIHDTIESPVIEESEPDPLEEQFLHPKKTEIEKPFPSLQHLLPSNDKVKEPLKVASHKPQIKLTLLPKKELDRKSMDDPSKSAGFYFGVKGPLSPPTPPVIAKPTPVLVPKKSASSRRDELLKQLKAVEDAIARKRAKFG